jgi:hypothetical protein
MIDLVIEEIKSARDQIKTENKDQEDRIKEQIES